MNIVCAKCGAGVAFELPALVHHTVVICAACHSGLRVTIEAFDVPVPTPSAPPETPTSRQRAVVAVQGEATRELIRDLLVAAGFDVIELSSGAETLAEVRDARPALVLVDVGLSDMPGFQVCETVRADSANAGLKMILVAAIHNKDRYRRPPDKLFGADDYVERHQIESELVDKVKRLFGDGTPSDSATRSPSPAAELESAKRGTRPEEQMPPAAQPRRGGPVTAGPATGVRQEPVPIPTPASAPPELSLGQPAPVRSAPPSAEPPTSVAVPADKEAATAEPQAPSPQNPAQEAALRLARIIVSDIALYNAKKVDEGILNGTFFELLRSEIEEGRKLYEERKGPGFATAVDLFQQTLDQFVATRRELLKRNRPAAA